MRTALRPIPAHRSSQTPAEAPAETTAVPADASSVATTAGCIAPGRIASGRSESRPESRSESRTETRLEPRTETRLKPRPEARAGGRARRWWSGLVPGADDMSREDAAAREAGLPAHLFRAGLHHLR